MSVLHYPSVFDGLIQKLRGSLGSFNGPALLEDLRRVQGELGGAFGPDFFHPLERGLADLVASGPTFDGVQTFQRTLFLAREQVIKRLEVSVEPQEPSTTKIAEVFSELGNRFRVDSVVKETNGLWGDTFKVFVRSLNGELAATVSLIFGGLFPNLNSEASFVVEEAVRGRGLGMALFQRHILCALELGSVSTINIHLDGDGISAWSGLSGLVSAGPLFFTIDLKDPYQVSQVLRSTEQRRLERDPSPPSSIARKWFQRYAV